MVASGPFRRSAPGRPARHRGAPGMLLATGATARVDTAASGREFGGVQNLLIH
jgi:hypothetical protein